MNYGFVITSVGWTLLTKMLAGTQLEISRIMVGSGRVADTVDPATLTELIAPVALATSTTPVIENNTVSFTVEYRSDLNGGLDEGFWLNEFGIYAIDPDAGEILLYYATLGDYPQYVSPYTNGSVDIRRYPVSIVLTSDLDVVIGYPALAFMTSEDVVEYINVTVLPVLEGDMQELIDAHNVSPDAHLSIQNDVNDVELRVGRLEDMLLNNIEGNPYLITFGTLDGLVVQGVWNQSRQRIEF